MPLSATLFETAAWRLAYPGLLAQQTMLAIKMLHPIIPSCCHRRKLWRSVWAVESHRPSNLQSNTRTANKTLDRQRRKCRKCDANPVEAAEAALSHDCLTRLVKQRKRLFDCPGWLLCLTSSSESCAHAHSQFLVISRLVPFGDIFILYSIHQFKLCRFPRRQGNNSNFI